VGDKVEQLAVEPEDRGELRLAKPYGALRDGVEHRLDIGRGATDDPQDLGRRGLLLEGIGGSRFRASSSLKSRTFSMAMTAWSANVFTRSIWAGGNGPTCARETPMVPMGWPSRSIGTARKLRAPTSRTNSRGRSGSASTSGMCTMACSMMARADGTA